MSKLEEDVKRLRRAREAEGAMEDDAGAAAEEGGTGTAASTGAAVVAVLQAPSLAEASAFTMLGHNYKVEEGLRRAKKKVLKKNQVRREPTPAEYCCRSGCGTRVLGADSLTETVLQESVQVHREPPRHRV
jgi:hypothetical protein